MWITILNCHLDKYIFVKSHFEDEERVRRQEDEERRRIGRIHICEVSLRRRRETSGKNSFENEERLRRKDLWQIRKQSRD